MTTRLTEHLDLNEPYELIAFVYAPSTDKADIAALSQIVIEEAAAGDEVAIYIIERSAAELASTAAAAARRLGFEEALPLVLTGGLLTHADQFRVAFLAALERDWPSLDWRIVDDPALAAAQSLARAHSTQGHLA